MIETLTSWCFWICQLQAKPYLQAGTLEIVPHSGRELNRNICSREHEKGSLRCCEVSRERCITKANYCRGLAELKEAYSIQLSYLASLEHGS